MDRAEVQKLIRNPAPVTAAGSTKDDATEVHQSHGGFIVSGADGTAGIKLRGHWHPGLEVPVFNSSGSTLKVYPPSGHQFGNGSVDAAVTVAAYTRATFWQVSATVWATVGTS